MQGLLNSIAHRSRRTRGFTLVEVMVVVVIIGLLAAMSLPAYRRITLRSKTVAVVNDLRAYSTAFITYNLQNGKWPADGTPQVVPPEMLGALPEAFTAKSPIGGVYKWNYDVSAAGLSPVKAAIIIESVSGMSVSDDLDLFEMIDREMDDGNINTGNVQVSTGSLVFIIEK